MKWNEESDRKLLLTILKACDVKLDAQAVANVMAANRETCTSHALDDRFGELKRMKRGNDAAGAVARTLVAMSAADEDDGAAGTPRFKVAAKAKSPVKAKIARKAEDNAKCEPM